MNRIVYISHSKAVSGLVVHPDFHPSVKELNNIPEVDFHKSRNYYMHNTAFSKFPKRINKGSPITYGLEFQAHTKHGVQLLIDKLCNLTGTCAGTRTVFDDLEAAKNDLDTERPTVRKALVDSRLGQGLWRKQLDQIWVTCAVTGCDVREILRGSHIKPWRDSSNTERLDPHNGLLLRADADALFDSGLITFDESGRLVFSCALTVGQVSKLPFDESLTINNLTEKTLTYLRHHTAKVFEN